MTPLKKSRFMRIDWLYANRSKLKLGLRELSNMMIEAGLYSEHTNWHDVAVGLHKTILPFVKNTPLKEWNRIKTMMTAFEVRTKYKLSISELRTYRESSNEIIRIGKVQQIYDPAKIEAWLSTRCKHVPI